MTLEYASWRPFQSEWQTQPAARQSNPACAHPQQNTRKAQARAVLGHFRIFVPPIHSVVWLCGCAATALVCLFLFEVLQGGSSALSNSLPKEAQDSRALRVGFVIPELNSSGTFVMLPAWNHRCSVPSPILPCLSVGQACRCVEHRSLGAPADTNVCRAFWSAVLAGSARSASLAARVNTDLQAALEVPGPCGQSRPRPTGGTSHQHPCSAKAVC